MYVPNKRTSNYEQKLTELSREINQSRIVEDFITSLSVIDKTARQKKSQKVHKRYEKHYQSS